MNSLVVDASVGVKWLVTEDDHRIARSLLSGDWSLIAPTWFFVEVANVLAKKIRLKEVNRETARALIPDLDVLPVAIQSHTGLISIAFDLATRFGQSVYDSLYLSLALRERCQFVTADRRFYNATAGAYPETLLWVQDIPVV